MKIHQVTWIWREIIQINLFFVKNLLKSLQHSHSDLSHHLNHQRIQKTVFYRSQFRTWDTNWTSHSFRIKLSLHESDHSEKEVNFQSSSRNQNLRRKKNQKNRSAKNNINVNFSSFWMIWIRITRNTSR